MCDGFLQLAGQRLEPDQLSLMFVSLFSFQRTSHGIAARPRGTKKAAISGFGRHGEIRDYVRHFVKLIPKTMYSAVYTSLLHLSTNKPG